jgi:PAS domain
MPQVAPVSIHLELYRYWLKKRSGRGMPARSDLNPIDIPSLLPFTMLVVKPDGHFRYRLIGSALTRQLGRDVTGHIVGSQFSNAPEAMAAKRHVFERVFTSARPAIATVQFPVRPDVIHNALQLILPLTDDGANVNMAISTIVARFNFDTAAYTDLTSPPSEADLRRLPVEVRSVTGIQGIASLEMLCLEWEYKCLAAADEPREGS